ncbi:trypsin-6-like [Belonocnema kinseyi]|uniref:trypsin-6-like n=1 Tax=Belonocnema kinseyi TaxID=2817044 RepID=UPI00143D4BCE|nr:trypsin-6-like [Belonocnema kinseyi]
MRSPAIFVEESSELHIRKKRLIAKFLSLHRGVSIQHARHLVNILRSEVSHCVGNILLPSIIIAPASCFVQAATYVVLSGSSQRNRGMRHKAAIIIRHQDFKPLSYNFDLALIKIVPPIGWNNHPIELAQKPLFPHSPGYITGWGCAATGPKSAKIILNELQIIEMNTIEYFQCQRFYKLYGENITLTMHNFCTFDPSKQKRGCEGGTPFIRNGKLAGIMPYREHSVTGKNPQVFLDLGHPDIKEWIDHILVEFKSVRK